MPTTRTATARLESRVTAEEHAGYQRAARRAYPRDQRPLSRWIRDILGAAVVVSDASVTVAPRVRRRVRAA